MTKQNDDEFVKYSQAITFAAGRIYAADKGGVDIESNQEDSILLNDNALKRGMFHTTVYHSYEIEEKMLNFNTQSHTEIGNPFLDPKFRETVSRKEGYIYDYFITKYGSS